jgi:hypothetical protein
MSAEAKAQEPSMEDILASIRRIIADDDGKAAQPAPSPKPAPKQPEQSVPQSQDDIDALFATMDVAPEPPPPPPPTKPVTRAPEPLDLTEQMAAPRPAPRPFRQIEPVIDDIGFSEVPEPPPPVAPKPSQRIPAPLPAPVAEDLLSGSATASIQQAFGALSHTILAQNARTLEDIVRDMLRPMLKSWLDDNLPTLVERLVRAEIERVSRGRP